MGESTTRYRSILQLTVLASVFLYLALLISCTKQASSPVPAWPELGPAQQVEPGIILHKVTITRGDSSTKLWLYLPDKPALEKIPCILIAPAGSRLFHGMTLGAGDRPEHLPYVRVGFAVLAYEIDGSLTDKPTDADVIAAARSFKDAQAGVANAGAALDYLFAKVPAIDPTRIYTAGHSSAASLSLLVAAHDSRINGCIAYAPACNVVERVGQPLVRTLGNSIPGYREFLENSSPCRITDKLRCPVFIFHADDDSIVPTSEVALLVEALKRTNSNVAFVRVGRGDHYDSMIKEGIPKAINWLETLDDKRQ